MGTISKLNGIAAASLSKVHGVAVASISKVLGESLVTTDPNTISLLHMTGADGSTTFTDEKGYTWTANGNAQIDTGLTSPFGDNAGVGLFDGLADYITTPDHANWQLDGGSDSNAWTVDFRVRFTGDPGAAAMGFLHQRTDNNNFWSIELNNNNLRFFVRSGGTNIVLIDHAWNPAGDTWYHVAIVKNGVTGYLHFVDGTQVGTTTADSSPIPDFTGVLNVGRSISSGGIAQELNGAMAELRISNSARWTAGFTPSTTRYTS